MSVRPIYVAAVLTTPFVLAAAVSLGGAVTSGCGESKPPVSPTSSASSATVGDAGVTTAPLPDAAKVVVAGAGDANDGNPWAVLTTASGSASASSSASAGPCWKGFAPTGNPEADVVELGNRCAAGMAQLVPPVKHTFKQGEAKSIPVAIVPGCYRIIAVGGKGVKDVDLALKDSAGKIVAADMTPDDVFPMIHPNKEFCAEAVQFLNLVISVKKGTGDVAGGVWKR